VDVVGCGEVFQESSDRFAAVLGCPAELVEQLGGPRRLTSLIPFGQDGESLLALNG
jgi:hypothetical protein